MKKQKADTFKCFRGHVVGKGYKEIKEVIRGMHTIRKPIGRILTLREQSYTKAVSSDRIIVENVFGRLLSFWHVLSHKWRWFEELYDNVLFI